MLAFQSLRVDNKGISLTEHEAHLQNRIDTVNQEPVSLELEQRPSPHWNLRPNDIDISLLVIHCISLPASQFGNSYIDDLFMGVLDTTADNSFADLAGVRVSAHCVIFRNGVVRQYVPFHYRAWHAGVSEFNGRQNCNDFSIGIELEGTEHLPYTDAQYQSLVLLTRQLMQDFPAITTERIVGHQQIAPGRKTDPGPSFDWDRYQSALKENG
ncbi:1,6-anhydro-N-acetylmuramyl-L-alanine amidase AmpD [Rheinheimera tangshanensis]|uniref:1,6-anhydro-N-acetylmuramyl-L-alanine amidase AmpD n=1 Tax=Rheinheimera tangshanensis TaxID=400153 RepID=A0A5C8M3U7_9GAMM|nr:1,6-anhydro-N-acetylmuramyl-L-alanine amidase AmpD [Rheinheimera tangshanensis]GGM54501.1 N-acetyl-anhydromuranmyl-L-alanine amidase [Rheinheimera tangshanensis]